MALESRMTGPSGALRQGISAYPACRTEKWPTEGGRSVCRRQLKASPHASSDGAATGWPRAPSVCSCSRRSNKPYEPLTFTVSVHPASIFLRKVESFEPPWQGHVEPVEGRVVF
jgi:hypothetical protein